MRYEGISRTELCYTNCILGAEYLDMRTKRTNIAPHCPSQALDVHIWQIASFRRLHYLAKHPDRPPLWWSTRGACHWQDYQIAQSLKSILLSRLHKDWLPLLEQCALSFLGHQHPRSSQIRKLWVAYSRQTKACNNSFCELHVEVIK